MTVHLDTEAKIVTASHSRTLSHQAENLPIALASGLMNEWFGMLAQVGALC